MARMLMLNIRNACECVLRCAPAPARMPGISDADARSDLNLRSQACPRTVLRRRLIEHTHTAHTSACPCLLLEQFENKKHARALPGTLLCVHAYRHTAHIHIWPMSVVRHAPRVHIIYDILHLNMLVPSDLHVNGDAHRKGDARTTARQHKMERVGILVVFDIQLVGKQDLERVLSPHGAIPGGIHHRLQSRIVPNSDCVETTEAPDGPVRTRHQRVIAPRGNAHRNDVAKLLDALRQRLVLDVIVTEGTRCAPPPGINVPRLRHRAGERFPRRNAAHAPQRLDARWRPDNGLADQIAVPKGRWEVFRAP